MFTESISERRYLRREEFRLEYYGLSFKERGDLSERDYVNQKMRDRDARDTILWCAALAGFGLLASLSTYF